MNEAYLGRGESRRMLRLGKLLGEGASGKVYAAGQGMAAKLYHDPEEARRYEAKIEAMLARPPELPPGTRSGLTYPQIAWPVAKLHDRAGNFIGFLMPEIDFGRSTSLVNLLQKNSRKLEGISDYYGYRVLVARNLASVFAELHRAGHHMIDMKPANLRFYPAVSWMAVVDADGFSIAGVNGRLGALQLSDEYIAPESWKRKPAELGLEQDLFALAAIIFQLLNNGVHPFAGTVTGSAATDLQARIVEGLYPYAIAPRAGLRPSTASIHRMFRRGTREMFDAAFLTARRPSAGEWRDHLDTLVAQLTPCAAHPDEHVHFGVGCGFCGHQARIDAVRITPRRAVRVRSAPPPRYVPPVQYAVPRSFAMPLPRKRRSSVGFVVRSSLLAAAVAGLVVASDWLWRENLVRQASAATLAAPAPGFTEPLVPMAETRDYLTLPAGEAAQIDMRAGPGEQYAVLGTIGSADILTGIGTAVANNGQQWRQVTRNDGTSGFVPADMLIAKEDVIAPLECPAGKTCDDGTIPVSDYMIGMRYRELFGRGDAGRRSILEQGQRAWEAERAACNAMARPAPCRIAVNARRLGSLDNLAIGGQP